MTRRPVSYWEHRRRQHRLRVAQAVIAWTVLAVLVVLIWIGAISVLRWLLVE